MRFLFISEAERGGEQGTEGPAERMAPPPARPGESSAAAGANPQEGEAQEGRGRWRNQLVHWVSLLSEPVATEILNETV